MDQVEKVTGMEEWHNAGEGKGRGISKRSQQGRDADSNLFVSSCVRNVITVIKVSVIPEKNGP